MFLLWQSCAAACDQRHARTTPCPQFCTTISKQVQDRHLASSDHVQDTVTASSYILLLWFKIHNMCCRRFSVMNSTDMRQGDSWKSWSSTRGCWENRSAHIAASHHTVNSKHHPGQAKTTRKEGNKRWQTCWNIDMSSIVCGPDRCQRNSILTWFEHDQETEVTLLRDRSKNQWP